MSKKVLKVFLFILKVGITIFILWSIFHKMDMGEVLFSLVNQPWWLLVILLLLTVLRHWGQYHNWGWSLQLNPLYQPNWRDQLNSYMIGQPLRFMIPGGFASAGKVIFVKNSSLLSSMFSFAAERLFLTWGTWTYACTAGLFYFVNVPLWIRLTALLIVITAPFWTYVVMGLSHSGRKVQPHYLRYAPRIVLVQLTIALISYLQYWLILRRIMPVGFADTLMRMSLTQFSNSIPITWAGLGLRESFAIHFLSGAGFKAIEAVTATLTLFIIQDILPALVGSVFFIRARK